MEAFLKSFQNLNVVQPFGPGGVQLSQDKLNIGGGLLQNNVENNMMPSINLRPFKSYPIYPKPPIKPICPKGCFGKVSKDLIVNGGFEKNKCIHSYCQYSLSTYKNDV